MGVVPGLVRGTRVKKDAMTTLEFNKITGRRCIFSVLISVKWFLKFNYSPFANGYLPMTYLSGINYLKVADTVADFLLIGIN